MHVAIRVLLWLIGPGAMVFGLLRLRHGFQQLALERATGDASDEDAGRGKGRSSRRRRPTRQIARVAKVAKQAKVDRAADVADVAGEQSNLLDALPNDAIPLTAIAVADPEDDELEAPAAVSVNDTLKRTSYGIDPKAHTRVHQLPAITPLGTTSATPASPSTKDTPAEMIIPASERATRLVERPDPMDDMATVRVDAVTAPPGLLGQPVTALPVDEVAAPIKEVAESSADVITAPPAVAKVPAPVAETPPIAPAPTYSADSLARATRLEDMGFHHGIITDDVANDPRNVTAADKERLLKALGVAGSDTEKPPGTDQRLHTRELNDILNRLDDALSATFSDDEDEEPDTTTATPPVATAPPVVPEASTPPLESPVVREQRRHEFATDSTVRPPVITNETDTDLPSATTALRDTAGIPSSDLDEGDDDPVLNDAAEEEAPSMTLATSPDPTDRSTDNEAEAEAIGDDQTWVRTAEVATDLGDALDEEPDESDAHSDATAPKTAPQFNVPDWARADSFDDPAEGGEQTDLFKR